MYRQDLLSGRDDLIRLNNGYILRSGFEANLLPVSFYASYEDYNLDFDKHESAEARLQYTQYMQRSSVMANIYDRYTVTRPDSYTAGSSAGNTSINTVGAGGSYVRNLFSTAYLTLAAYYFNTQGGDINRNDISVKADFRWNYGKLQFYLTSQGNWRFDEGRTASNESVHLQIRRYF
jgi:hypothetical protein